MNAVIVGVTILALTATIFFFIGWISKTIHYKNQSDKIEERLKKQLGKNFSKLAEEIEFKSKPWNNDTSENQTNRPTQSIADAWKTNEQKERN